MLRAREALCQHVGCLFACRDILDVDRATLKLVMYEVVAYSNVLCVELLPFQVVILSGLPDMDLHCVLQHYVPYCMLTFLFTHILSAGLVISCPDSVD